MVFIEYVCWGSDDMTFDHFLVTFLPTIQYISYRQRMFRVESRGFGLVTLGFNRWRRFVWTFWFHRRKFSKNQSFHIFFRLCPCTTSAKNSSIFTPTKLAFNQWNSFCFLLSRSNAVKNTQKSKQTLFHPTTNSKYVGCFNSAKKCFVT